MASLNAFTTINDIISEYMIQSGVKPQEYIKIYKTAIGVIRDINVFDYPVEEKTVKLEINQNLMANLPEDFVLMKTIGIPVNGKIYLFTKDEGIITTTTESNGEEVLDANYGEGVDINPEYYPDINAMGGTNLAGYFKFDYANRRIVFRNVRRTEVLLEYRSTGVSLTGETFVPTVLSGLIKSMITYERVRYDSSVPMYLKDDYLRQVWLEQDKVKSLRMPSIQEVIDAYYSSSAIVNTR